MQLIIDAGSSKADCGILQENENSIIQTEGFNPFTHDLSQLRNILEQVQSEVNLAHLQQLSYYGAGINPQNKGAIQAQLRKIVPNCFVHVESDLLGAARSAAQHSEAIVSINGTGSNACIYDGKTILQQINTLGYILGDEGSGSHLGKALIQSYFYQQLPHDLCRSFEADYGKLDRTKVLQSVYRDKNPNTYLATYAKFIHEHKNEVFVKCLILKSFGEYIRAHLLPLSVNRAYPVYFVGSIGYYFRHEWELALSKYQLGCGGFLKKPIHGLIDFHRNKR